MFVRSVRGDGGQWYQAARQPGARLALHVNGELIPVRAEPADDDESVRRYNVAVQRKYAGDPSTPSMLRPYTLATTLRLEPA